MAGSDRPLSRPHNELDVGFLATGLIGAVLFILTSAGPTAAFVVALFVLLGTSTVVVTEGLERFTGDRLTDDANVDEDTGWLIGKLENVLLVILLMQNAYTALSIIFAAKSIIRREDISSENTTYYLAGTLLNFTYSIGVGIGVPWILGHLT